MVKDYIYPPSEQMRYEAMSPGQRIGYDIQRRVNARRMFTSQLSRIISDAALVASNKPVEPSK